MRQAARLIVWAFGQQNMSVDFSRELVDCMPVTSSGDLVVGKMEKSEIQDVVNRLPDMQRRWALLTYTVRRRRLEEVQDLGALVGHVMNVSEQFGANGQIKVKDVYCTVEAITMMVENAVRKTINGHEKHSRQKIVDVLGIDYRHYVPSRFWGRMLSAVNKITADLDSAALDAVDRVVARKEERGEAA